MEKEFFINLKKQIQLYLPEIKHIARWNNQFVRSNGTGKDGRKEKAFDYPVVFIQFNDAEFRQLSLGIQEFDIEVTTHLGYKSFETEDEDVFDLKERLYYACQRFQQDNWARLSRVKETFDTDHDDVSVILTQYHTRGIDDFRYVFGQNQLGSLTALTLTETVVTLSGLSTTNNFSGTTTSENGNNEYQP
jgi:hypothetical protein